MAKKKLSYSKRKVRIFQDSLSISNYNLFNWTKAKKISGCKQSMILIHQDPSLQMTEGTRITCFVSCFYKIHGLLGRNGKKGITRKMQLAEYFFTGKKGAEIGTLYKRHTGTSVAIFIIQVPNFSYFQDQEVKVYATSS